MRITGFAIVLLAALTSYRQFYLGAATTRANIVELKKNALILPAPKDRRLRPLIVILADNGGTETTDFVIPYGVLMESGAADVVTVSTEPGTVELTPALRIRADMTIRQFDESTAVGADILIVPAMVRAENPVLLDWVRFQSEKGATVVSICEGARIIAHAGLLEGKAATTHWSGLQEMAAAFSGTTWVYNQRVVIDGQVMTTTGISASLPASLVLVEAIAGRHTADLTARRLGLSTWHIDHDTSAFSLTAERIFLAFGNWLAVWRHEAVEMPVDRGFDEISAAIMADAWSRTFRSEALATNVNGVVRSRHGLLMETETDSAPGRFVLPVYTGTPAHALDAVIEAIAGRYGAPTADFVALQFEYPRR
ncbi:DJ-1/PfpI family protein [Methylomonas sp. HYX-M1]|uniref:DJ-1/PfpI family protein n=1 Tax=Methylomonas sp. HYX-M1 TaxID=3139307 RepID=UPI00345C1EE9